jgi:uncharacterized membrane protein
MAEHRDAGVATPTSERDPRLERLLFLSDGVYAIALTLLAVELVLPESAADLHGGALLDSLLESWPRVLAFLISFTVIANFWVGHNVLFQHVRRFDGGLMWLALLQLLCVAFIPYPTSVIGQHIVDPVAQQFYFATLLLTGLVMATLWLYMNSGRRLVHPDLSQQFVAHLPDLPDFAGDLAGLDGACGRGYRRAHQPATAVRPRDAVLYRIRDTGVARRGSGGQRVGEIVRKVSVSIGLALRVLTRSRFRNF